MNMVIVKIELNRRGRELGKSPIGWDCLPNFGCVSYVEPKSFFLFSSGKFSSATPITGVTLAS
jgi:hypothetical protein